MRREYVETISSQAAPSPARHLLTSSAPSPTFTAVATPTSRPFKSLHGSKAYRPRVGGQPIVKRALRPPEGESSRRPRATRNGLFRRAETRPEGFSEPRAASRPRCDYYSRTMLHYILWPSAREVKSEHK